MQMYTWSHDGLLLDEGERMSGTASDTLRIQNLYPADSGAYTCSFEDTHQLHHVTEPYELVVPDEPAVPAGHLIPFVLLAGTISIIGCCMVSKRT